MKATKKIVGAACALVAAVALSAGSTFAWFATSGKASATGMKVQTTVPTNLYIAAGIKTSEADFTASTVDFEDATATTISPVTFDNASGVLTAKIPKDTEDGSQWTTAPDVGSAGTVATDGYVTIGTVANTADFLKTTLGTGAPTGAQISDYVYAKQMSLMNKGGADTADLTLDVTVTVTIPENSTTINFLKCGFIVEGSSGMEWKAMTDVAAGSASWTAGTADTEKKYEITGLVTNLKVNVAQAVTFVVWYEGNDEDCYANNALALEATSFSIAFVNA